MPPAVPKTSQRPRGVACGQTWAARTTTARLPSIVEALCGACRPAGQHCGIELCQWLQVNSPDASTARVVRTGRPRAFGVMASQVDVMEACCLRSTLTRRSTHMMELGLTDAPQSRGSLLAGAKGQSGRVRVWLQVPRPEEMVQGQLRTFCAYSKRGDKGMQEISR